MIVNYLNPLGVPPAPFEANSPLPIYANAELACAIASQLFELVAGDSGEFSEASGGIQDLQLSNRDSFDALEALAPIPLEESLSFPGSKAPDHISHNTIICHDTYDVKRIGCSYLMTPRSRSDARCAAS